MILPDHYDGTILDEVCEEYSQKIEEGVLTPPDDPASEEDSLPGRTLNPHHHVGGFQGIMADAALLKICQMLLDTPVIPFQSIASPRALSRNSIPMPSI